MRCNKSVVGLAFVLAIAGGAAAAAPNWAAVTATFGRDPIEQPGGIHRYDFPRTDLAVTVDGGEIKAGFALGSWLAYTPWATW
jgi:hypothetical protein